MCASSVCSDFRNFRRAGVLKNRSRTAIVVPARQPRLFHPQDLPAGNLDQRARRHPPPPASPASPAPPTQSTAAPPRETPASQSTADRPTSAASTSHAAQTPAARRRAPCRSRCPRCGSACARPPPPPPGSASRPHPAQFSSSSFTTDAGRSTTSPAAIWFATWSERMRMRPIATILRCQQPFTIPRRFPSRPQPAMVYIL